MEFFSDVRQMKWCHFHEKEWNRGILDWVRGPRLRNKCIVCSPSHTYPTLQLLNLCIKMGIDMGKGQETRNGHLRSIMGGGEGDNWTKWEGYLVMRECHGGEGTEKRWNWGGEINQKEMCIKLYVKTHYALSLIKTHDKMYSYTQRYTITQFWQSSLLSYNAIHSWRW